MLAELITSLITPFPRIPRRMGLLHEQIAIRARERRCRAQWAGHLAASRQAMLDAAGRCPAHGLCVVVGAGLCLDVPLVELARRFASVVLLDVGFLERSGPANVRRVPWDATNCMEAWFNDPRMDESEAINRAERDPGWPPGVGQPDLTISANIISQLDLLPGPWLSRKRWRHDDFRERLAIALATTHLRWLRRQPGAHLLIGDMRATLTSKDGSEVEERTLAPARVGLREPDRAWDWDIAPIPEWNRRQHLRHRVGAWFEP